MIISLDYDRTYTEDPVLWNLFITQAQAAGHTIVCVSMRTKPFPTPLGIRLVLTAGRAKLAFCKEIGLDIDVWIDDQPWRLVEDALG